MIEIDALTRRLHPALLLDRVHGGENDVADVVEAVVGVQHKVVEAAAWPIGVEVLAHEFRALAIDGVDHLSGVLLAHFELDQSANLFLARAVDEYVKGIGTLAKNVRRAAADNHAVALGGLLLDDGLRDAYQ